MIDTSALLAILLDEAEADRFRVAIRRDPVQIMSAASVLESSIVLQNRLGEQGARLLDGFLQELPVEIRPVDIEQLKWARHAFATFGRGRHSASLNFGDCFSYALSKATGERLLFKGGDFSQTDIAAVIL